MAQSTPLQFVVPGMATDDSVTDISQAIKAVDPKASITADLKSKRIVIGSCMESHEVAGAIEKAGFKVEAA